MHFTVPEQVNDSDLSHGQASLPARVNALRDELRIAPPFRDDLFQAPQPLPDARRVDRAQVLALRSAAGAGL
jgi:hypothetical protein